MDSTRQNLTTAESVRGGQTSERFLFIDALRGITAFFVVYQHFLLYYVYPDGFISYWGSSIERIIEIFLVISGFVIAHSLAKTPVSGASVANFLARRIIRLTPVYWLALAATLLVGGFSLAWGIHDASMEKLTFSLREIVLNALYLPSLAGTPFILNPAWMLCIEVQFYFFYIALLWLAALGCHGDLEKRNRRMALLTFATGAVSFFFYGQAVYSEPWVFPFLGYFALGSLAYFILRKQIGGWPLPAFVAAYVLLLALKAGFQHESTWINSFPVRNLAFAIGLTAALLILAAGKYHQMAKWSGGPVVQYYGKISYSLYVIHIPILSLCRNVEFRLQWSPDSPFKLALFGAAAFALTTLAAQAAYWIAEAPSARLARALKPSTGREAPPRVPMEKR